MVKLLVNLAITVIVVLLAVGCGDNFTDDDDTKPPDAGAELDAPPPDAAPLELCPVACEGDVGWHCDENECACNVASHNIPCAAPCADVCSTTYTCTAAICTCDVDGLACTGAP